MKIFRLIIVLCILLNLLGCSKSEETLSLKGNIVGFVNLFDEEGNEIDDKSDVTVSIEGLDKSVKTNENGRYKLSNIPAGTYNLTFDKTNFSSYKRFSYQFIGGNIPALVNNTYLYESPNIELKNIDITYEDNKIIIFGDINTTNQVRVQVFMNANSNVSNLNYEYTQGSNGSCCTPKNVIWEYIYMDNSPYKQGDKIYLVIYFMNYDEDGYYDYEKETRVYTSYTKASEVIEFTLE